MHCEENALKEIEKVGSAMILAASKRKTMMMIAYREDNVAVVHGDHCLAT